MSNPDDVEAAPARSSGGLASALAANAILVGLLAVAWLVEARWPESYYRLIPEDELVEWATFWAEILASFLHGVLAWRAWRRGGPAAAWYRAGIALFCFLVAGEEISWGQRLIGFQPSAFFLANNVQLETNAHNLFPPWVWSAGIEIVIAGFGVLLPLVLFLRGPAALARRWGIYGPPASWIPGFAFVVVFYVTLPYDLCEEVVELTIGIGLMLAALGQLAREEGTEGDSRTPRRFAVATALALLLGWSTTAATEHASAADATLAARAAAELEALRQDFVAMRSAQGGKFLTECNLQARLHSLDSDGFLLPRLKEGAFARLASTDSARRAQYLLDPWNMPYWISDQCDPAARYIMLFSFGPNRRRESTDWAVGGDDVATYAFHLGEPRTGASQAPGQANPVVGH